MIDNQTRDKIIKMIKDIIPYGRYLYTDNVISRKDIDGLIKDIEELK